MTTPVTCVKCKEWLAEPDRDLCYVCTPRTTLPPTDIKGGELSGIELQVTKDIAMRQQWGLAKYKTTVADNPLSRKQWLQHAYEEALDLAVYLKKVITDETNAVPRD